MIEREFIKERTKYLKVKEYLDKTVGSSAGIGDINIEKTPLGEKIIISAVRPGLVIGRGGKIIQDLTSTLRKNFKLENPQIQVKEIEQPALSAAVMAKKIASDLERFGSNRFKAIGYRTLTQIMRAGALGAEINISGRGVPGARAHSWRFPAGYMKKSGQIALEEVDNVTTRADLRSGTVGIRVRIMHPSIKLPDNIEIKEDVIIPEDIQKEIDALNVEETKMNGEEKPIVKTVKKKIAKKKPEVKEEKKVEEKKDEIVESPKESGTEGKESTA